MSSKDSGYTDAERAAIEWRKNQRKTEEQKPSYRSRPTFRDRIQPRRSSPVRSVETYGVNCSSSSSHRQSSSSHQRRRRSPSPPPTVDEFGRIIPPDRLMQKQRDRGDKRRSSRSRSRSRDDDRSSSPKQWTHDLFDNKSWKEDDRYSRDYDSDSSVEQRRRRRDDYRPPSPKWISKAGGVAIMRHSNNSKTTAVSAATANIPDMSDKKGNVH